MELTFVSLTASQRTPVRSNSLMPTEVRVGFQAALGITIPCLLVSGFTMCVVLLKGFSHLSQAKKDSSIDIRLILPLLFVSPLVFIYCLLNLIVFSVEMSSVVAWSACFPVAVLMEVTFVVIKLGIFVFLLRKAQVIDCAFNAHKFFFWLLYATIGAYGIITLASIPTMTFSQLELNGAVHCQFFIERDLLNKASTIEIVISLGSFLVFLKPFISLCRKVKSPHVDGSDQRRLDMKNVVMKNFWYGSLCLFISLGTMSYFLNAIGTHKPYPDLLASSAAVQIDIVVEVLTLMVSTKRMWFSGLFQIKTSTIGSESPNDLKRQSTHSEIREVAVAAVPIPN